MECDIYRSSKMKRAYVFVKAGAPNDIVPESILQKLGSLEFFKTISFDVNSPLIAANPKEVIESIEKVGYHIQGAGIETTEISEAGAAIGGGILLASLGGGPLGAIIGAVGGYFLAHLTKEEKDASDS